MRGRKRLRKKKSQKRLDKYLDCQWGRDIKIVNAIVENLTDGGLNALVDDLLSYYRMELR